MNDFRNCHIRFEGGTKHLLSMVRVIMLPILKLVSITIPFIDRHVNELWLFHIFLDCFSLPAILAL